MPAYQQIFFWYYDEPTPPYQLITYLKGDGADEGLVITDEVPGRVWAPFTGAQFTSATRYKFGNAALRAGTNSTIYLTSPLTDFKLDTDYTVEMWLHTTAVPGAVTPLYLYEACGVSKDIRVIVGPTDNPTAVRHQVGSFFVDVNDGGGSPFGRWIHIFAGKRGNSIYIGMNGIVQGINGVTETIVEPLYAFVNSHPSFIGGGYTYLDEFWILKGGCRYTSNFTVIEPPLLP